MENPAIVRKILVCTGKHFRILKTDFIKFWEPINIYGNSHLYEKRKLVLHYLKINNFAAQQKMVISKISPLGH